MEFINPYKRFVSFRVALRWFINIHLMAGDIRSMVLTLSRQVYSSILSRTMEWLMFHSTDWYPLRISLSFTISGFLSFQSVVTSFIGVSSITSSPFQLGGCHIGCLSWAFYLELLCFNLHFVLILALLALELELRELEELLVEDEDTS